MRFLHIKNYGRHKMHADRTVTFRDYEKIVIVGNEEGLKALRDAIDRSLTTKDNNADCLQHNSIGGKIKVQVQARDYDPEKYERERQERMAQENK